MSTPKHGGPAFPLGDFEWNKANAHNNGMTLRTYIATAAMQGLLADHKDHSDEVADGETCPQTTARLSVEHADALIAELSKPAK